MEYRDYYKILGLKRDATKDEIKRAYRRLARKYHPDVSKEEDAETHFKEVNEAYEVLKDPEKRAAYDQLGSGWQAGQDFRPPPDWDKGFSFHGGGFTNADASQFSDFFASLFGRGFAQGGQATFSMRGADSVARVQIDLEDAYLGAARTVTLRRPSAGPDGHVTMAERRLNVRIPRGVRQGQHIRLTGQGGQGQNGGAPGDLYLEIEFRPHPLFHAEGRDVYLDLPVAPWEAALGATVKVPTPTGAVDLKVPAGSQAGRKLRLKGRGLPSNPPGDFYAVLQIALPAADSPAAQAAYRDMAAALDFNPRVRLGG